MLADEFVKFYFNVVHRVTGNGTKFGDIAEDGGHLGHVFILVQDYKN